MPQGHFHAGLHNAQLVAHVVPGAGKVHSGHAVPAGQGGHGVGQLDFPARPGRGVVQDVKDFRRQHAAAQNGVQGELLAGLGLFHHVRAAEVVVLNVLHLEGGVLPDGLPGDLLHAHHAAAELLIGAHQLAAGGVLAQNHVVAVQHGKGLVPHKFPGAANGVAKALCLLLAHVKDVCQLGNAHHLV